MEMTNLKNRRIKIAPSILSANFAKLGDEILKLSEEADYIHIDVMDGSFVPNISIGSGVVKSIRSLTEVEFDVHLMTHNIEHHIKEFSLAGADLITIHFEACTHLDRNLRLIKSLGKKAGISLIPSTHESNLDYLLDIVDYILIMTVNPGFGGQEFLDSQLKKIESIRNKINGRNIELAVDGGINLNTAAKVINAGADVLISGNYIFEDESSTYSQKIINLRNLSNIF